MVKIDDVQLHPELAKDPQARANIEKNFTEHYIEFCKQNAEQGYADSQWFLGRFYQYGLYDFKQDYVEAFKWHNKAAQQGHPISQQDLGDFYRYGYGIEQDYAQAFKWYKKAVENHSMDARLCLGDCYYYGYGVEQDYSQAAYWYEQVNNSGSKIISQWVDVQIKMKNFDLVKQTIEEFYSNDSDKDYSDICLTAIELAKQLEEKNEQLEEKNKALESEIKQKEVAHKALHEKEKEMLSFFTHTMRNALATAPESLRQAIRLLGSEDYEKNKKQYKAINKIAALFSTLSLTDCLIDTFKQSINDPEEFKLAWQKDNTGDATLKWVIASALRQSLNRIIFMSDASQLEKLLNITETSSIVSTRKSFIETVLPLNVDNQGINAFYEWLNGINSIEISIAETNCSNFGVNQVKFSLLFAITSELILNALKYWNGIGHIQISWQLIEENYIFTVKNPCHANASSNLAGTHKGIAFINRLMELLGDQAHFNCIPEEQHFTAQLKLHKSLLGDNA